MNHVIQPATLTVVLCMFAYLGIQDSKPCKPGTMVVESQVGSPLVLTLKTEGNCDDSSDSVDLIARNISGKVIRSYMIETIKDYEYKKCVISSEGISGNLVFDVDQEKVIHFEGGFEHGLSHGKPVGNLQRSLFRVSEVEFTDGQAWEPCPTISVSCPVHPGTIFGFQAFVSSNRRSRAISYTWSVANGTIRSGQGTSTIEVEATQAQRDQGVAATLEVQGLDLKCSRTASCTTAIQ